MIRLASSLVALAIGAYVAREIAQAFRLLNEAVSTLGR